MKLSDLLSAVPAIGEAIEKDHAQRLERLERYQAPETPRAIDARREQWVDSKSSDNTERRQGRPDSGLPFLAPLCRVRVSLRGCLGARGPARPAVSGLHRSADGNRIPWHGTRPSPRRGIRGASLQPGFSIPRHTRPHRLPHARPLRLPSRLRARCAVAGSSRPGAPTGLTSAGLIRRTSVARHCMSGRGTSARRASSGQYTHGWPTSAPSRPTQGPVQLIIRRAGRARCVCRVAQCHLDRIRRRRPDGCLGDQDRATRSIRRTVAERDPLTIDARPGAVGLAAARVPDRGREHGHGGLSGRLR